MPNPLFKQPGWRHKKKANRYNVKNGSLVCFECTTTNFSS